MAEEFDTVSVDKLDSIAALAIQQLIPVANINGKLFKATVGDIVTFITPFIPAVSGSGLVFPDSNNVLPNPTATVKATVVGNGTYTWSGGSITLNGLLNILATNGTAWVLVKAVDVSSLVAKVDYNFAGIYNTIAAANAAVPNSLGTNGKNQRDGKRVDIGSNNSYTTYWWKGGVADVNLVPVLDTQNYRISGGSVKWRLLPNNNYQLTVTGNPLVFFPGGGFAKIQDFTGEVSRLDRFVWLSGSVDGTTPLNATQDTGITTALAYVITGDRVAARPYRLNANFPVIAFVSQNNLQTLFGFSDRSSNLEISEGWQVFQGRDSVYKVTRVVNGETDPVNQPIIVSLSGTSNLIIAPNGGTYSIDPFTLTVQQDQALVLSLSATDYIKPTVFAGSGTVKVFMIAVARTDWPNAVIMAKCPVLGYLASNWSWSTIYDALKIKDDSVKRNDYHIGAKGDFVVIETGTSVTISVISDGVLFDCYGGYRFIPVQSKIIPNQHVVYLSASATEYQNPNVDSRGSGQLLYMYSELYNSKSAISSPKIGAFPIGVVWKNQWHSDFDALRIKDSSGTVSLSADNVRELNYTLPVKDFRQSTIKDDISVFVNKYLAKNADVTLVAIGDSITTPIGNNTSRSDAAYRPPLMVELNINSYLEEKLRWKEQQYRRYDSKTAVGGSTSVFTEILGGGTATSISSEDATWGFTTAGTNFFFPLTRCIDGGTNSGVSYSFPAGMRRCNLIIHTDYKFADNSTIAITGGNGKVEVFNGTAWVEANGYVFSGKETNTLYNGTGGYYHKDQYQKRINMRSLNDLTAKTVTITNNGTGRFGYWGIEYSPREFMFTFIAASKGGHDIARLRNFEPWMVDAFNPDLVLQQCCIINEKAQTGLDAGNPITRTADDFANAFGAYYDALVAKNYLVLPYILFIGKQAGIVNTTTGEWGVGSYNGKSVTVSDYIGSLVNMYEAKGAPVLNFFFRYLEIAYKLSEIGGTGNIYTSAILGSTKTGTTLTTDNVHLNDYGVKVGYRLLEKYFNF